MRAVHLLRHEHAIITLCRVLNVNRNSYYKHFNSKEPKRTIENRNIKNCILQIYSEAKCRYGAQKMRKVLEVNYGIHISQGRLYRLMKQMQLPKMSTVKPKFKAANKSSDRDCHNILKQNFNPKEPNKAWCSDITYIKAGGRFYYLCVIIDLFSRRVIAYKISSKIDARLVLDTFESALKNRNYPENVIFHSDRGSQYTSDEFRKRLDRASFIQSFSKKGHPYDNAVAEAFFKFLKLEETNRRSYASFDELELSVFEYIHFYNFKRPHSANDLLSPIQFEELF